MNSKLSYLNNANPAFIEDLHSKFRENPNSVPENWRYFFEGYRLAEEDGGIPVTAKAAKSTGLEGLIENQDQESKVVRLINAYRNRGHLSAQLNPLEKTAPKLPDLELPYFGLSDKDLDTVFNAGKDLKIGPAKLRDIHYLLKRVYASNFTVEFTHCDQEVRQWIYNTLEPILAEPHYNNEKKKKIFYQLSQANFFEEFLHTKYTGQKRFGLEGGESLIPGLQTLIASGTKNGAKEFVFGMAHRGRLNVLVNILQKSYYNLFTEFEGGSLPEHIEGDGDVKYHLGQSADIKVDDNDVHLSLTFNPSHLEAVNPIVTGIAKGKCKKYYQNDVDKIIPVLIHGDAAVAGQGVVYEHANMSQLPGYRNGGSVHIVINNQVGFTANPDESRSSHHCTEVAKITNSPIFHVNGDNVEMVCYAFELAMEIRNIFHIDVWIDIIGYRRRGHNEGDEPKFTQPIMYENIEKHPTTYEIYRKQLLELNVLTTEEADSMKKDIKSKMEAESSEAKSNKSTITVDTLKRYWQDIRPATRKDALTTFNTGVPLKKLTELFETVNHIPDDFNLFPKTKKILENRKKVFMENKVVDWTISEQLAYASILNEGNSIRLTGQDSERGTFGHRHAIIKDIKTEKKHLFYDQVVDGKATFVVINSQLSEYSILGYEYGFSLARPHALVIWEAQFGDFANGAQIMIDQFISSGLTKWQRHSGITLYLPHGYEGMGPEHSSARLERFLQLCAGNNMYVMNISDPANLFHALRRQIHAPFRKPLIIMTPKSLLRHPKAISPVSRLEESLVEIIDDEETRVKSNSVKRVILCTGKVYYELYEKRDLEKKKDIAIIRLEQIYPLQLNRLNAIKKKYAKAKEWLWVQEEPVNMGAWTFINHRLVDFHLKCVARKTSSSPASGIVKIHQRNQQLIIHQAICEKYENLPNYY